MKKKKSTKQNNKTTEKQKKTNKQDPFFPTPTKGMKEVLAPPPDRN